MSRIGFIALCVIAFTACGPAAKAVAGKTSPPVQLTIETTNAPEPGRLTDVSVKAVALADTPQVELIVDLPDDLALFSGDTHWQGAMRRGEARTLRFRLRVPESGAGVVHARALARWGETVFGTQAALHIGMGAKPIGPALPPAREGVRDFPVD